VRRIEKCVGHKSWVLFFSVTFAWIIFTFHKFLNRCALDARRNTHSSSCEVKVECAINIYNIYTTYSIMKISSYIRTDRSAETDMMTLIGAICNFSWWRAKKYGLKVVFTRKFLDTFHVTLDLVLIYCGYKCTSKKLIPLYVGNITFRRARNYLS
jgi:hypothetical protein